MKLNFPVKWLYGLGTWGMMIMVLGNSISLYMRWALVNDGDRLSGIGGIFFNLVFMVFFFVLYFNECKKPKEVVVDSPDLDNMLKELNQKEVKQNG
jgi:hypothetical protein